MATLNETNPRNIVQNRMSDEEKYSARRHEMPLEITAALAVEPIGKDVPQKEKDLLNPEKSRAKKQDEGANKAKAVKPSVKVENTSRLEPKAKEDAKTLAKSEISAKTENVHKGNNKRKMSEIAEQPASKKPRLDTTFQDMVSKKPTGPKPTGPKRL